MSILKLRLFYLWMIFLLVFILFGCETYQNPLTDEEQAWIKENNGVIRFTPDPHYPPIDFLDENGTYTGLTADYIKIIEKRLGIQFKIIKADSWATALDDVKNNRSDIITPIQKTENRSQYLLFTDPYIEVPVVIITSKKNKELNTLERLRDKKVAVIKDYAVIEQLLEPKYPYLHLIFVKNTPNGLVETSFGDVDAMIAELPTATYYLEKMGISNLTISGRTSFNYHLGIGSRKDLPILNSILEKGLSTVTPKEREKIKNRWITLNWEPFYKNRIFQIFISVIGFTLIVTVFWNRLLKKEVKERLRVELKLKESERKFRSIIEASPMGIHLYHMDKDHRLIFTGANQSADKILGIDNDQFIGKSIEDAFPQLKKTDLPELYLDVCQNGGLLVREQIDYKDETVKGAYEIYAFQTSQDEIAVLFFDVTDRKVSEREREKLIHDLQNAQTELKNLSGLLPICASCKKIRDDNGYWNQIESYIQEHSEAEFSHGICPECSEQLYGDKEWYVNMKNKKK